MKVKIVSLACIFYDQVSYQRPTATSFQTIDVSFLCDCFGKYTIINVVVIGVLWTEVQYENVPDSFAIGIVL